MTRQFLIRFQKPHLVFFFRILNTNLNLETFFENEWKIPYSIAHICNTSVCLLCCIGRVIELALQNLCIQSRVEWSSTLWHKKQKEDKTGLKDNNFVWKLQYNTKMNLCPVTQELSSFFFCEFITYTYCIYHSSSASCTWNLNRPSKPEDWSFTQVVTQIALPRCIAIDWIDKK